MEEKINVDNVELATVTKDSGFKIKKKEEVKAVLERL
jgi:20S proteasome alpha/beta subunit